MFKNLIQQISDQFYYHNGTMRMVYQTLFGSNEIVLEMNKDQANNIKTKMESGVLSLKDFQPFRNQSEGVNQLFSIIELNLIFENSPSLGGFKLVSDNNNVFLELNGTRIPRSIPTELWTLMLKSIEEDDMLSLKAYVNFFARIQQNPMKLVRDEIMNFLMLKDSSFAISTNGTMFAFKQLVKLSDTNRIYEDAIGLRPILSNKIKKSPSKVNMFYLNGEPQLTEGSFENISERYPVSDTVQWIGTVEYALSLDPTLPTYTDDYTKNQRIVEGLEVIEPKGHVNHDPNRTCVKGLHIYPLNTSGHKYYNNSLENIFMVEVDPINICAIPNRKNYDKSRVFKYTLKEKLVSGEGFIEIPDVYLEGIVPVQNANFENIEFPDLEDDISVIVVEEENVYQSQHFAAFDEDGDDEDIDEGYYDGYWGMTDWNEY